jgi:hypothetical protein
LKCQGKKRGYIEKQAIEHSGELTGGKTEINVVMDKNWYANENRLDAILPAASGEGASLSCPSQGCVMREAVGKNGNGSNGNGHRTRPEQ